MNSSLKHIPRLLKTKDPQYLLALFWDILLEPRLALDFLALFLNLSWIVIVLDFFNYSKVHDVGNHIFTNNID